MEIKFLRKTEEILNILKNFNQLRSIDNSIDIFVLEPILKKCFLISLYSEFEYSLIEILFRNFRNFEIKLSLFEALKKGKIKQLDFNGIKELLEALGYQYKIEKKFKHFLKHHYSLQIRNPKEDIRWNDFLKNRHKVAHNNFEYDYDFSLENLKILLLFAEFLLQELENHLNSAN